MANDQSFAGIQQVKDGPTARVLRVLWDQVQSLRAQVKGPKSGTLSPDQKPANLTFSDAGVEFFSTDFNRTYRWTGSTWTDSPTAPSRYQISTFAHPPEPSVGWILCDGRPATISTSSGGTTYATTPSIPISNGLSSYLRA